MEIFCWSPSASTETIDAFNTRLQEFCNANPVLDVTPSVAGSVIGISLTEAADAEVPTAMCLIPQLVPIPRTQLPRVEAYLGEVLQAIKDLDSDDAPYTPFRLTIHDVQGEVFALVLISGGELELAGDAGDVDDPNTGAVPPSVRGGAR